MLGENIKYLRKEKGLTQEDLAFSSGITVRTIQRYEANKGKPSSNNLIKLANGLNVDVDTILNPNMHKLQKIGEGIAYQKLSANFYLLNSYKQDILATIGDMLAKIDCYGNEKDEIKGILRSYSKLPEKERTRLYKLVNTFADSFSNSDQED